MKKIILPFVLLLLCITAFCQNPLLLKDVYPGATGSGIQQIVKTTGFTFFNAEDDDADADRGLYRTDGTAAGTIKLNLTYPTYLSTKADKLTAFGDKIIFAGDNFGGYYGEIWASDGTQAGTIALERFQPNITNGGPVFDMAAMGGFVYYGVVANNNKTQIRRTDGTPGGTSLVYEFSSFTTAPEAGLFKVINDVLYFNMYDNYGAGNDMVWRTDGTTAGTYMLRDMGAAYFLMGNFMAPVNGKICFMTGKFDPVSFPNSISVLFSTDGTPAGTVPLKEFASTYNNNLYPPFALIGSTLYLSINDGSMGKELWKTDGSLAGTIIAADINSGSASSNPANLTVLNSELYFSATTITEGNELWKYNGTAASLVKDINPGSANSSIGSMAPSGNTILFRALTASTGSELWITDGTAANTLQAADINPGVANSVPNFITPGNPAYFSANNGVTGAEIFKFDNTEGINGLHKIYVNDNSATGDIFTTAIGNNTNQGTKAAPVATISYAVSIAQEGDIIMVDAGTYVEQVTLTKGVTIMGAGQNLTAVLKPANTVAPPGPFVEQGVIQTAQNISDVHLKDLSITADYTVNVTPIIFQTGGSVKNCNLLNGNQGIYFRVDAATNPANKTILAENNTIGAEYIGVNFAGTNMSASLINNNITVSNPGFSAGLFVGQDFGPVASFTATGNFINNYVTAGLQMRANISSVTQNKFAGLSGLAIQNSGGNNVNATCNWYGSADAAIVVPKLSSGIIYSPWLSNGTDNDVAFGFQPVPGTCNGRQNKWYVNDNSNTGNIFTTAIGNDGNSGIPTAPFATINYAIAQAQAGDEIYVDAGTYITPDINLNKALTFFGANRSITPNDAVNKLLPNAARNAEATISGATFTIATSNLSFKGFTFDPGNKSAFVLTNTAATNNDFGNFSFEKNIIKINNSTASLNQLSVTGKFVLSPALPVTSGYTIADNRFEKSGSATGNTLNFNYVKNISVTDNSFVVTGATFRTQQAVNLGATGLVDAVAFTNNAVGEASAAIGGNRIAGAIISGNKMQNLGNAFAITNNMPESSNIEFSNNEMGNDLGTPFMLYTRNGTSLAGTSNILKVENNIITGVSLGNVNQLFGTMNFTINNSVLNPSVIIRGNKINYSGDFSSVPSQTFRPITVRGNIGNTTIENNELILNNSGGLGAFIASTPLPVNPAITIGTDNGTAAYMTSAAVVNILNNKIQGYKQSAVFYDVSAAGHDAFTGYGNIPAGAIVNINNNSFTADSISINNGTMSQAVNASCNWYGSSDAEIIALKITPTTVNYAPWLTSGTDNSTATGFQPVPGSCNGRQNKFYVNDNSQAGDVYTTAVGNNSNNGFSSSPFATITYAISQAQAGDEIYADAGTYAERIFVNKPLTIKGAYFGTNPGGSLSRGSSESILLPATENNLLEIITVQVADVSIDGFLFDGNNPAITGSITLNGVDVNAGMGIYNGNGQTDRLVVKNNIFKNFYRYGMLIQKSAGTPLSSVLVSRNHIDNISSKTGRDGRAIGLFSNIYGSVSDNMLTRVYNGILIANYLTVSTESLNINNNTIQAYNVGIFSSNNLNLTSAFNVNNNNVSVAELATWNAPGSSTVNTSTGINILVKTTGDVSLANNIISGTQNGMFLNGITTPTGININGGSVSNCTGIGIFYIANAADNAKLKISNVSLINNDVGIDASYSSGSALPLEFNNTTITGGATGLRLYGNQISLPANILSGVSFASQSAQHILLTVDAFTGQNIDATSVRFNGLTGAEMTLAQLLATEDKIVHKIDNEPFGFIRIKAGEVFLTENSFYNLPAFGSSTTTPSLERAINSAAAADIVNVGAGLYNTADLTLNKALTFLGSNASVTPNDAVNKLLPNTARNAEAIISGATFNIATSNLSFKGFTFDPGNKSAFVLTNTAATNNDFGNFIFEKNMLKITHTTAAINQFAITGKFVTSPALPVTAGYNIADNRFEKSGSATGNTLNFNYIKNISATSNAFVVTGATFKTQQAVNLGSTGLVDAVVFSNNAISEASTAVGGNRIAGAIISTNEMQNVGSAFVNTNNMPESSNIEFSNNLLSNTTGNGPFLLYNRNGTSLPGTSSSFLMENNTMTALSSPGSGQLFGALNLTINNSVVNPSVAVRGNKLLYNGDYSTVESQYMRPLTLRGNIGNSTIENNDIIFNNTGGLAAANPAILLPENPGITIGTDVSSAAYMTSGGIMNIRNNKIQGFKQSLVFFDGAPGGRDAFSGFGNIPAAAVVNINENSFTNDVISINNGTASQQVNATCNWYGTAAAQSVVSKITPSTVNYIPWLIDGTDASVATGFQPIGGSCNGTPVAAVVTQVINITCNGADNGSINVTISGGSTPYSFAWSKNNVAGFSTLEDLSGLALGTYDLVVTDANGSTASIGAVITQPDILFATATGTNVNCFGGSNGSATVNVNGGTAPYSYLWSNGSTTNSINGLVAGNYSVTVTDANGCATTASYTVTQPTALTVVTSGTNVSCFGNSNGTATVTASGGTAPYTYLWNNTATTNSISGLAAGNYSVAVTDANGCTTTASYTVTQPIALTAVASGTNASCYGGVNGSATVIATGGTALYTYLWSNAATTNSISGLVAGNYSVIVTDANGCTTTASYTVTQPTALTVVMSGTNVNCYGGSNGTATVTATGGTTTYSYLWSNGATTNSISSLAAGNYTVIVTDANLCTSTGSFTVTQPAALTAVMSGTNVNCYGGSNGSATANPSGGTAPYTYLWNNMATTNSITGLAAGNYSVTVTDAKGCIKTGTYLVTQPAVLTVAMSGINTNCSNSATATPSGGTAPYAYSWSNGANTQTISGIPNGTYTVIITDAKNCTVSGSRNVNGNSSINPTASVINVSCFGQANGIITVTGAGGVAPRTYNINGGPFQTSNVFTGLSAAVYVIGAKDANGCVDFVTKTVSQPAAIVVTLNSIQNLCFGGTNGSISINVTGGAGGNNYSWTGPGGFTSTNKNINNLTTAGNYTVTVTDNNGCTKQFTATLLVAAQIVVTAQLTNLTCKGSGNGAISIVVSGGSGSGFTFSWSGPGGFSAASQNISNLAAGRYDLTVTDATGCTTQKSYTLTEPTAVNLSTSRTNATGCNSLGKITATATGGTSPYQFKLNNGTFQSSGSFTGLYAGSYVVTAKDAKGCTDIQTLSVTDNGEDDYEKNDTKNKAAAILIGSAVNARIAVGSDPADWFKFTTPAGAGNYFLSLTHPSASFAFNMYAAGNNTPALVPAATTATTKEYTLAGSTTYYISVTGGLSYVCYDLMVAPPTSFTRTITSNQSMLEIKSDIKNATTSPAQPEVYRLSATAFPNPHQGSFKLQINSPEAGNARIELFTVNGEKLQEKTVLLQKLKSNIVPFIVSQHGTIFYRVSIGDKIITGKILSLN